MIEARNTSGCPLSSDLWLEAHHRAKLPERSRFAQRIAAMNPSSIVDIGCGTGVWLDMLDKFLPNDCPFFGIDADCASINSAYERSKLWKRPSYIVLGDINDDKHQMPAGNLYLCFNVLGYVSNIDRLLKKIHLSGGASCSIVIRQYDGSLMRFGPMTQADRHRLDGSLSVGVEGSCQFRHYTIDKVISAIARSSFKSKIIDFENFHRTSPFSPEVSEYLRNTIDWAAGIIDLQSSLKLKSWLEDSKASDESYVLETDLVSVLS